MITVNPSEAARRLEALARSHNLDPERLLADFAEHLERTLAGPAEVTSFNSGFKDSLLPLDSLIEGCLLIDREGQILDASQPVSALCGYTRSELVGMNFASLIVSGELKTELTAATGDPSLIRLRHRRGYSVNALVRRVDLE
ncbi:MAG: PAS domain-containing protein, partial [Anaerolinea sp.]|nr:PAS domain-containing protein [Anaerolinea sp.]